MGGRDGRERWEGEMGGGRERWEGGGRDGRKRGWERWMGESDGRERGWERWEEERGREREDAEWSLITLQILIIKTMQTVFIISVGVVTIIWVWLLSVGVVSYG
jgi:hypothetical protein